MHFDEASEPLSPEGVARRTRMRAELQGALGRCRRRRTARRVSGACAIFLLALGIFRASTPPPVVHASSPDPVTQTSVVFVRTDPETLKRFSVSLPCRMEDHLISDAALMRGMAEAGKPSGLIRVNGQVFLEEDIGSPAGDSPSASAQQTGRP